MTSSGRALLIAVVVCAGLAGFVVSRILALLPTPEATFRPAGAPAPSATAAPPIPAAEPRQPAAPAIAADTPMAPRFDVVRVGARGVAVVAGRAMPGAEVLLLEDGREIGRGRADPRGEWVILPADPLGPGSRQFSLLARAGGGEIAGPDVVVVAVPAPVAAPQGAEPPSPAMAEAPSQALVRLEQARNAVELAQAEAARREAEAARLAEAAAALWRRQQARAVADQAEAARRAAALAAAAEQEGAARQRAEAARRDAAAAEAARDAAIERAASLAAARPPVASRPAPPAAATPAPPLVVLLPPDGQVPRVLQGPAPRQGLALGQVDYDEAGAIRFAGTAPPHTVVRIYVNDRHAGDSQADAQGRWALAPEEAVAAGRHRLRLDQLAMAGAVASRIEVPFQRDTVAPAALPRDRVVVQPGDSLWRLARASYGEGTRFTLIFEANRQQIRDADLIFPGQVFALPEARPADSSRSR